MSNISEDFGEVISVNISTDKGTSKEPVEEIHITFEGVRGDAHAGPGNRQVSVLGEESIQRFITTTGRPTSPGEFAENITVRALFSHPGKEVQRQIRLLDRLRVGDVELEVAQIGKECHGDACAIYREVGQCVMPKEGIFCRVLQEGTVRPGSRVEHLPRTLNACILTLSDRAFRGDYPDRSGPRLAELLAQFCQAGGWALHVVTRVLPDDADALRAALREALDASAHVIFTTGGTGVGPRDTTPDVAAQVCDRLIPGIMEHIRARFGAQNPNALLSRSIAGVAGSTLVYTLPGSVRAVEEYMGEIIKTLEHIIYTLHGVDTH